MKNTYTLWAMVRYFLYLGTAGFGGPVALVEYMHRDLVERRHWLTEDEYREGLALANLSPGPLAAQLAIYLGFVHHSFLGATLVGLAFVLPSFLMVVAIGWAYLEFGGLSWMQAVFYGVGAAIIGIIAWSAYRLTRKTIASDPLLWVIFLRHGIRDRDHRNGAAHTVPTGRAGGVACAKSTFQTAARHCSRCVAAATYVPGHRSQPVFE